RLCLGQQFRATQKPGPFLRDRYSVLDEWLEFDSLLPEGVDILAVGQVGDTDYPCGAYQVVSPLPPLSPTGSITVVDDDDFFARKPGVELRPPRRLPARRGHSVEALEEG